MRLRQKHVSQEENGHTLPFDLFDEIFSRLSAKTIARCRCVSKLWSSILHRPDFTDRFLKISSARPQLLFTFKLNGKWLFFSSPQPQNLDENSSLLATNHHMCFRTRPGSCGINVPIRGLLCTTSLWLKDRYNDFKAMVYNPSTGQTITLPNLITRRDEARTYLGYDPINKQVKVLCMSLCSRLWNAKDHQVLTLGVRNMSWRKIQCSLPHYPISAGICINGVLYYIADQNKTTPKPRFPKPYTVVCFDVLSEKFTFINQGLDNKVKWSSTLINYTGKLGVLRHDHFGRTTTNLELWVLDDIEKHKWLIKIHVFPPLWRKLGPSTRLNIVGMTSNGEFVFSAAFLRDPFYIFYYNVEKNTIVRVEIQGIGPVSRQDIYTFIDHAEDIKRM
ncbi:PREDICTED: putative F-box protein At2g19630 [Camelina sativa]|uniref:F-box protein At2g19630 n=1 Tax=Camelina sativa TaxID=90675 RepID=A0ABM0V6S0_CAMSA|nr:PREDICTED: putative F-box protein At2g19630 [Camelina sativa]